MTLSKFNRKVVAALAETIEALKSEDAVDKKRVAAVLLRAATRLEAGAEGSAVKRSAKARRATSQKLRASHAVSVVIDAEKAVEILGLEHEAKHLDERISDMAMEEAGGVNYDLSEDDDDYNEDADPRAVHEAREDANMEARTKVEAYLYNQWLAYLVECFDMIKAHNGGRVDAEVTDDGKIELTILNPEALFTALVEGDGMVAMGEDENWSDRRTVEAHLSWLGSFFDIYDVRKPRLELRA